MKHGPWETFPTELEQNVSLFDFNFLAFAWKKAIHYHFLCRMFLPFFYHQKIINFLHLGQEKWKSETENPAVSMPWSTHRLGNARWESWWRDDMERWHVPWWTETVIPVDGSEIRRENSPGMVLKPVVNNWIYYQPQLVSLPDFWTINSMVTTFSFWGCWRIDVLCFFCVFCLSKQKCQPWQSNISFFLYTKNVLMSEYGT